MRQTTCARKQQGAVLFVALIALVAMMLGALALLRSVDSATGIAGNIGFRQQGVAAADAAVDQAVTWLGNATTDLNSDQPGDAYYTVQTTGFSHDDILTFNWDQFGKKLADQNGYQLWYVIHRLCTTGGSCVWGRSGGAASLKRKDDPSHATLYRITARALGPRRSESIVQVLVE